MKIPDTPWTEEAIQVTLEQRRADDIRWREGRAFGFVYDAGRDVEEVARRAYALFMSDNALDPTAFPSLLGFENDLVAMAAALLESPEGVVGNVTSGGTESIILAVKAARDHARSHKPDIEKPELILADTGHAAFHKAAHYLGLKVKTVPVDPETFSAIPSAMEEAITPNTVLLVGSTPSYAHGVMDPIAEIAALALKHDICCHVDACVGGFLLPFLRRLGRDVPTFDFRVPGVTSISMDLHKYAYVPKGASVVLYKSAELRKHQFFTCSDWAGYSVINPTVQSSRSGGPLAMAWAVLHYIGQSGYMGLARDLDSACQSLYEGIEQIDGLHILGTPCMSLVAVASDALNIFHVVDEMKVRGWYVQAQLAHGASPPSMHLSVAPSNIPRLGRLLEDLHASVAAARTLPPPGLPPQVEAMLSQLTPDILGPDTLGQVLGMAGLDGVNLPERMADINGLLNAMPANLSEPLLTEFVNQLFVPSPHR